MNPLYLVRESSDAASLPRCYVPPLWETRVTWAERALNWWHTWKARFAKPVDNVVPMRGRKQA